MGQPQPHFVYFRSFQTQILQKNCKCQRDSNLDHWTPTTWPPPRPLEIFSIAVCPGWIDSLRCLTFGRRKTGRKTSQFVPVSSPFTSYLVRLELNLDGLCSRIISELSEIHFLIKKTRLPNICKFRSIIDIRNEIVCIKDILMMVHSDFWFFIFNGHCAKGKKCHLKRLNFI